MKKIILYLCLSIVLTLASCDLSVNIAPPTNPAPLPTNAVLASVTPVQIVASPSSIPATVAPNPTATAPVTSFDGLEVSVGPLSIVLPPGLSKEARGGEFPRAEGQNVAPWDVTPGHTELKLEGYLLQGKAHEPRILVYPAQAYAELYNGAFESMHRLDNIILGDQNATVTSEQLPTVPFFTAQQAFASNIQVISFQNGRGVRFLTEYAQYAVSANNHDLFYHFQGLTSDGAHYVVAIFPISVPLLAETSDAGAPLPTGGVPYPYFANPNADMGQYYLSVTDVLNATPPEMYTPTISQLDLLIQSMRITP